MIFVSAFPFAARRLWAHRGLAASLILGLVIAVALAVGVPLYADGINFSMLNRALTQASEQSRRAPFNFVFRYIGSWHGAVDIDSYDPVDGYLSGQVNGVIGLPRQSLTRYIATDSLQLYPQMERINRARRLEIVRLAFQSEMSDHIEIIEGTLPQPVAASDTGEQPAIEALASLSMANTIGLKVGETYLLYQPGDGGATPYRQLVKITGVWVKKGLGSQNAEADDYWSFYSAESFEKKLLIPEETFRGPVAAGLELPLIEAGWRIAYDGSDVSSSSIPTLLRRISQAQNDANAYLVNTDLETSPAQALRLYQRDSKSLTGLLFAFSAPVLGLIALFLGLTASMLVRRQRGEIAVLRSRGASRGWVASVYLIEWLFLAGLAMVIGPWLGMAIARLVGLTESFLDFSAILSANADFPLRLTLSALGAGAVAAGMAVLFSLLPAWIAGRDTILSYKRELARARQHPLWQRMFLDVLLLIPSLYGLYTLNAQGRLRLFGQSLGSTNPLENPAVFLLPAMFITGMSLLTLRIMPLIMSGLAWLAGQLPHPAPLIALRQLARSPGSYRGPLLLTILTLSLAGYVASMAHTLDNSIKDSAYYSVGADLNLVEGGEYTGEEPQTPGGPNQPGQPTPPPSQDSDLPAVWNFLPVSDHRNLPGVVAAARVGRFDSTLQGSGRSMEGELLGIDRQDFSEVAFYRYDFSQEALNELLNRMGFDQDALLVDRRTWERLSLAVGDSVDVRVRVGSEYVETPFKVVGALDYFPTRYPEDGAFFLANLEYLFESWGGLQPYDVWLRTTSDADTTNIIRSINNLGISVITVQDARMQVETAFASPNRQGMLGMLSVGFLAALMLTVVGFWLYALTSVQERFIQLGVLRAIGFSIRQVGAALALEQLFLTIIALVTGTGIAVLTATLYIPHLPASIGTHPGIPPYLVEIAWGEMLSLYIAFGVVLLVGVGFAIVSLGQMKIFQTVKLGENV